MKQKEFMEELKKQAHLYKKQQLDFIEKLTKSDLKYIELCETINRPAGVENLRSSLEYISNRYDEMRIINRFVEWVDSGIIVNEVDKQ